MNLHRVGRVAGVLLASQLRSGRSLSDPRSLLGRPVVLLVIDVAIFVGVFGFAFLGLRAVGPEVPSGLSALAHQLFVLAPVLSVGAVLIAGVMFEFSSSSRFTSSDAINWLPVTPEEFVIASTLSVALVYSSAVAFLLGITFALALYLAAVPTFLFVAGLCVVALFEGGVLIEMLRAGTQRVSTALSGRKGRVTLVLRAVLFLVVVLLFELAFNPLLLEGLLGAVAGFVAVSTYIPFFWASRAVAAAVAGAPAVAAGFAGAELAFVGALVYAAAYLRVRLWSPAPAEVTLEAHAFGTGHATLARLGLSPAEASLVWKDLVGLARRREMLPILILPLVLALVGFLQPGGGGTGGPGETTISLWGVWVSGFFALMLATTSLGQERRAIQTLFSFPLTGRNLFRAKSVEALVLGAVLGAGLSAVVVGLFRPPFLAVIAQVAVTAAAVLVGTFVGLSVAVRYSDFQERPRPQFVRPWAMVAGMLGGLALIFVIALPGLAWTHARDPFAGLALGYGALALVAAGIAVPLLYWFARRGAERFLDELPV